MSESGLVHVYTGDGKGKTTAAVGLCVRAAGAGLRVLFVQFMKARPTGELAPLEALGIRVFRAKTSPKFVREMTDAEKSACREAQQANLAHAEHQAPECDLIVLDEVMSAITTGMLSLDDVLAFLEQRPPHLEVVLTGRDAPEALRERADYVSVIRAEKHPYQTGRAARNGIEF